MTNEDGVVPVDVCVDTGFDAEVTRYASMPLDALITRHRELRGGGTFVETGHEWRIREQLIVSEAAMLVATDAADRQHAEEGMHAPSSPAEETPESIQRAARALEEALSAAEVITLYRDFSQKGGDVSFSNTAALGIALLRLLARK